MKGLFQNYTHEYPFFDPFTDPSGRRSGVYFILIYCLFKLEEVPLTVFPTSTVLFLPGDEKDNGSKITETWQI